MINFLTLTNDGYISFADSQIENFKKSFLQNHTLRIFCADSNSYNYHKNKKLPNNIIIQKLPVEIFGHHPYRLGRFEELTKLKIPIIINSIKELKSPVWFIDNDILIFKDPEPYINYSKDILFQADMGDYPSRYGWVCSGCFWVNNTTNAISVLSDILEVQKHSNRGDQECLNDYCKSWPPSASVPDSLKGDIRNFKGANLDILSYYEFQNGYLALRNSETQYDKHDCVMVHFNHELTYENKLKNMQLVKSFYDNK
jgi:hypothetical protein